MVYRKQKLDLFRKDDLLEWEREGREIVRKVVEMMSKEIYY